MTHSLLETLGKALRPEQKVYEARIICDDNNIKVMSGVSVEKKPLHVEDGNIVGGGADLDVTRVELIICGIPFEAISIFEEKEGDDEEMKAAKKLALTYIKEKTFNRL